MFAQFLEGISAGASEWHLPPKEAKRLDLPTFPACLVRGFFLLIVDGLMRSHCKPGWLAPHTPISQGLGKPPDNCPDMAPLERPRCWLCPCHVIPYSTRVCRGRATAEVEFHLALDAILSAPTEAAHSTQAAKPGHLLTSADLFHPRARQRISAHNSFAITVAFERLGAQLGRAGMAWAGGGGGVGGG